MTQSRWQTQKVGSRVIQSGLPMRSVRGRYDRMNGLLLRGVVTATYEVDNPNHPVLLRDPNIAPVAIYCDVLCYSSMVSQKWQYLRQVLVSQDIGGLHRGRIWKPRAAKLDITGAEVDLDRATNPAHLDGDHVLVGFIDDNPNTPVILRGVPHPANNVGNEAKALGQRMTLRAEDGDPDFLKHHGSYFGIADNGDYIVDTREANDGVLEDGGKEKAPPTDGSGSHVHDLPLAADHVVTFYDMSDPANPVPKFILTMAGPASDFKWELEFVDAATKITAFTDSVTIDVQGNVFQVATGKIELGAVGAADKASLDSLVQVELGKMNTHDVAVQTWEAALLVALLAYASAQTAVAIGPLEPLKVGLQALTAALSPLIPPIPPPVAPTNSALVTISS